MATEQAPPAAEDSTIQLDVPKLHSLPSEQQDLYLLTFTSDLARHVESLDEEGASAHQIYIKKELFQVINLATPAPTRVIRNNLGRCFAGIFGKGNRKLLYESINELGAIINSSVKEKDIKAKHAAVYCLGSIYEAAGDSAVSLSAIACTSALKLLKASQAHTGLRSAIFRALGRLVKGIGPSIDEQIARDVWKQARSYASSDKAQLVQTGASWCLEQLLSHTPYFDNSNDFEKLQTAIWKTIDSPSDKVRHAAASCLSAILVKSLSATPNQEVIPKLKKPKKGKKQANEDDGEEEIERASSPAPQKAITSLSFSLIDIFRHLSSQYCRPATSNRARAGIAVCYQKVITGLGEGIVEKQYSTIAKHLFNDLLSHPTLAHHRYRGLITRKFVRIILKDVAAGMLGETAQLNAARFLLHDLIKDYPQEIKERPEPSKQALTGALGALTSLIQRLDAATSVIAELCRDGLIQVLQHPSYTVQVYASRCLRAFILACPQQLLSTVTICMNNVERELKLLGSSGQSSRRCAGYANGLAAVLSTSSRHTLYGSVDVYSKVLSQATALLKSSGSSDLRVSSTQVQVAWIMIGGLMSLGPNFVKIHLPQLLLLWRNALPLPSVNDRMAQRNLLELSFLTHVRECALGSLMAFLQYNSKLLTSDVSKRLATMLQNTAIFLSGLPAKKTAEDISLRLSPHLQLLDFEVMVRRRVFQCYTALIKTSPHGAAEIAQQSNVLPLAVTSFADPENYAPSSMSVAIASSAGSYDTVWEVGDNSGFGVNGMIEGLDIRPLPFGESTKFKTRHWTTRRDPASLIDRTLLSPIVGAWEHDAITSYVASDVEGDRQPQEPATEVVNAAIGLFALVFPLQSPKIQDSILEQILSYMGIMATQKETPQKAALAANIALAILAAVRVAGPGVNNPSGSVRSATAEKALQDMLHLFVMDPDQNIRSIAAEALGRLCNICGNDLTDKEVKYLVELIVTNREPHVRSGCASALACIHSQLGGMAAGYHLKNVISILMSLAADPHPMVHFWALESLCKVADSAGLTFSSYVSSTIGLLGQLYVLDSHNAETASQASSNLEMELATAAVTARCIDSIINVLGPDLQDMAKPREMVLTLIRQFEAENDVLVLMESLRCLEHLSMYAPGHVEFAQYVQRLHSHLDSSSPDLRAVAIDGLSNAMQRDADEIIRTAKPGLEERLWDLLDEEPDNSTIKNIFSNWLSQTCLSNTNGWIQRCNTVLTKAKSRIENAPPTTKTTATAQPDIQDDEIAGFAAAADAKEDDDASAPTSSQELIRWQVRFFAMDLLTTLLDTISKDAIVNDESPALVVLQQHVAEVIRIGFSASTAGVVGLRVRGLRIIDTILRLFGSTPDPDFTEATLLEQYQAQISSALTPAFAADSSPELAAEAVNVCASFISTGIVTDVDRMGRILKLLVTALDNFSTGADPSSIGDLKGLNSNAQVMVRMAVFSAWAGLQMATAEQKYLLDVVKPYVSKLTPLWLSSLQEYARLRFEPDASSTTGTPALSASPETTYAALNRETLLKFYQDSWLNLVDAIASLIDEDSDFVFDALDGKVDGGQANGVSHRASDINYREEPVAFFFVLFGLAFEALVGRSSNDGFAGTGRTLEILLALKKILRPSVSGNAIYQEAIFSETMDLLDRMVLTEGTDVQTVIVDIARNLCVGHPSSRHGSNASADEDSLSDDIDQLFELTRIIVLVLAGIIPGLAESNRPTRAEISYEAVSLARLALDSLVDVAEVFPSIIKADLHACIFHIFVTVLGTGSCQATLVPQVLPIFRRFVSSVTLDARSETRKQVRGTLTRFLAILKNAQKRESEASLPCEKNTILGSTILITSSNSAMATDDPVVARFIAELGDCLENRMTTKMAAGCARSLLVMPATNSLRPTVASKLLPRLLSFLAHPSDLEDMDQSRTVVAQALVGFVTTLPPAQKSPAIGLLIPTLLSRAVREGEQTHRETASRLVDLAAADQSAFRATIGKMDADQKALMERIIREGQGPQQVAKTDASEEREPTIALKMNF